MSVDATAETTDAKCSKVNGAPIHNVRAINYISFDAIAENLVEPWLTMHTAVFFYCEIPARSTCAGTPGTAMAVFSVAKRRSRPLNFSLNSIH